jgi:hypothetical protein
MPHSSGRAISSKGSQLAAIGDKLIAHWARPAILGTVIG